MRKSSILTAFATAAATAVLVGGPAVAGNGHFIASATSVTSSGTELIVKFKEAGLESGATVTIQVSAHLDMTVQCVNGGNKVPSDPKKTTISSDVSNSGQFTAGKNGNITGSLSVGAPSAASVLSCPGGQKATTTELVWSNVSIDDLDTGAHLDL
jgi:hypothetical protein